MPRLPTPEDQALEMLKYSGFMFKMVIAFGCYCHPDWDYNNEADRKAAEETLREFLHQPMDDVLW